jgi:nucleoid DNA-binding protein/cell division septation protein DedD
MLDDYIKDLIESNNRVIIPNFGAFLLRATSKNKNKKELAAKVQDIYFSPFLKFNDELLVNHIMKKEETDQKGAMDKINEYIKKIEEKVKDEGSYKIEGLGEFKEDNQGKIQFTNTTAAPSEEKTGKEEKPKEDKKQTEKKPEEKKAAEAAKSKTINQKASESKKKEEPVKEESKQAKPEKEEPKKEEPKKEAQPGSTPSGGQTKAKAGSQQKAGQRMSPRVTPPAKKKSNKGLILSIAIGVPIAVVFIWAMLNFDTVENLFSKKDKKDKPLTEKVDKKETKDEKDAPQKKQKEGATEQQKTDKKAEKTAEPQQKQEKAQTAPKSTGSGKKFYIVAGSFKKKQNAVNFRKKLIDEGYNAELIGERNGMHAVSYASFQSKSKAQSELKRLREEKGVQAWLLYY